MPPSSHESVGAGDTFYPPLLALAERVRAKVVCVEVADMEQARRVVGMMRGMGWRGVEVWRDCVFGGAGGEEKGDGEGKGEGVVVREEGNGRCVVGWR